MKTEYEYIHFVKVAQKSKTSVWECRNNSSDVILGEVRWDSGWRQYCSHPTLEVATKISAGCHTDMAEFMVSLRAAELAGEKV